jgi:hypothetical protein
MAHGAELLSEARQIADNLSRGNGLPVFEIGWRDEFPPQPCDGVYVVVIHRDQGAAGSPIVRS